MEQPSKKKKPLQAIAKLFQKSNKKDRSDRQHRSQSKEQLSGNDFLKWRSLTWPT